MKGIKGWTLRDFKQIFEGLIAGLKSGTLSDFKEIFEKPEEGLNM